MKYTRFFIITVFAGLTSFCSPTKSSRINKSDNPSGYGKDKPIPPPAAAAAGYTKLAFYDDFNSISTIDMAAAGCPETGGCSEEGREGFKWFRAGRAFGSKATPAEYISVKDGILYLDQKSGGNNAIMTVYGKKGGGYGGFAVKDQGAYFEASLSFPTPPDEWFKEGPKGAWVKGGWPSFWTMDACHLYGNCTPYMELDFMEYLSYWFKSKNSYNHALHRWIDLRAMGTPCGGEDQPRCHQIEQSNQIPPDKKGYLGEPGIRSNNIVIVPEETEWSNKFNTVGSLLKEGEGIFAYFNDQLVSSNTYEEYPWMEIADNGEYPLIFGSGNWPFQIDWVRVWVKP